MEKESEEEEEEKEWGKKGRDWGDDSMVKTWVQIPRAHVYASAMNSQLQLQSQKVKVRDREPPEQGD